MINIFMIQPSGEFEYNTRSGNSLLNFALTKIQEDRQVLGAPKMGRHLLIVLAAGSILPALLKGQIHRPGLPKGA
jgi:hypothetical protein